MKYLFLIFLLFFSLLVSSAVAKPTEIILYPTGATVSEKFTVPKGSDSTTLLLPHVAIPESLKLGLLKTTEQKITGVEFTSTLPNASDFKELEKLISQLEKQIAGIDDQIQSRTLTLDYWKKQQDLPVKTLAEVREMGKIIAEESITLLQESTQLQQQKTDLQKQLEEARKQLQQKTGNNQRNWQVQVRLSNATKIGRAHV